VEKTLPPAAGGEKVSTGMGLLLTSASGYENLPVVRVHDSQHNRGEQSVARYYELPTAVPLLGVDVAYLNACSPKPATDSYLLYHKAPQGWESLASETNLAGKRITSRLAEPVEVSLLAAFPFPELGYSQYITPNADGINDCFTVAGIEKFPDTRLVILLPNGSVIYDVSPYSNDFCGEGLSTGTYYYMFFTEKSDKKPVKRGFFELVKEE
ncbi:MAG: gliding motility-associated C-terminal domain-containing protein, partial [Prevotellaceae bacterium]|nr:gliding motility-associated C-terminal domain-containing protein [Prevotellaceae bacterium]